MEAVGEIDLVDGAVGARAGIGESIGDGRDGEHPAAFRNKPVLADCGSSVENRHALDLLGSLDIANKSRRWPASPDSRGRRR